MISKIQANNSNVNFQAKVFPDRRAAAYLHNHPELAKLPFEKQIEQLQNKYKSDIVLLRGLTGEYEEGIELTVHTKKNYTGSAKVNNAWLEKPDEIDLLKMYAEAKADLHECSEKNACYGILNVCG